MSKALYVGIGSKARKIYKTYTGIGNIARKVKKAYVGINNKAKNTFNLNGYDLTYIECISLGIESYVSAGGQLNENAIFVTDREVVSYNLNRIKSLIYTFNAMTRHTHPRLVYSKGTLERLLYISDPYSENYVSSGVWALNSNYTHAMALNHKNFVPRTCHSETGQNGICGIMRDNQNKLSWATSSLTIGTTKSLQVTWTNDQTSLVRNDYNSRVHIMGKGDWPDGTTDIEILSSTLVSSLGSSTIPMYDPSSYYYNNHVLFCNGRSSSWVAFNSSGVQNSLIKDCTIYNAGCGAATNNYFIFWSCTSPYAKTIEKINKNFVRSVESPNGNCGHNNSAARLGTNTVLFTLGYDYNHNQSASTKVFGYIE